MSLVKFKGKDYGKRIIHAIHMMFNPDGCTNVTSGNVQGAIEELDGAVSEVNSSLANKLSINNIVINLSFTVTTGTGGNVGVARISNPFKNNNIYVVAYSLTENWIISKITSSASTISFIFVSRTNGAFADNVTINMNYMIIKI